jgi:hypothetical protein
MRKRQIEHLSGDAAVRRFRRGSSEKPRMFVEALVWSRGDGGTQHERSSTGKT